MKGVFLQQAKMVSEDNRRTLFEVVNGQLAIRNLKILYVKQGDVVLGKHWHSYAEVRYMMEGRAVFQLENVITGEKGDVTMEKGDVLFVDAYIHHTGTFAADSVMIEGATEMYFSPQYNDHN